MKSAQHLKYDLDGSVAVLRSYHVPILKVTSGEVLTKTVRMLESEQPLPLTMLLFSMRGSLAFASLDFLCGP
jgi:hypothetical protein